MYHQIELRRGGISPLLIAIAACVLPACAAPEVENPYAAIVARNPFRLVPPVIQTEPKPIPPPPPKVFLQGITDILGKWQVLGKVQLPARPPEPAREVSFVLKQGEREGEIEVLAIDGDARSVRILNHGTEQLLTMEKDAAKVTTAALPPPMPPAPPLPRTL